MVIAVRTFSGRELSQPCPSHERGECDGEDLQRGGARCERRAATGRNEGRHEREKAARTERRLTWINVWSPWDILGGRLEFYDTPQDDTDRKNGKRVHNVTDPVAMTPLVAHVQFWKGRKIYEAIHNHL